MLFFTIFSKILRKFSEIIIEKHYICKIKRIISVFDSQQMSFFSEESQNVEYKLRWRDDYIRWICGFANANGGTIYIGVDDEGNVKGVDNAAKLLEALKLENNSNKLESSIYTLRRTHINLSRIKAFS